jgi:signal transduction histidine kinase
MAPPLAATLRAVPTLARAAIPTLETASEVAPALDRLGRRAAPVVSHLRTPATELSGFAQDLDPVTSLLAVAIPDLLGSIEGWARTIQTRDAAGHAYKLDLTLGDDVLQALRRQWLARARKRAPGRSIPRVPVRPGHAPPVTVTPPRAPAPRRLPLPKVTLPTPDIPAPEAGKSVDRVLHYLLGP